MQWVKTTIGEMVDQMASRFPDRDALVFKNNHITYKELQQKSTQVAKALLSLGIGKDDKVALWMFNNPEWVYTWLGTMYIGAVSVPVNIKLKAYDLEFVLKQSNATSIVLADKFERQNKVINYLSTLRELCGAELDHSEPGQLKSGKLPELKNVICLSNVIHPGTFDFKGLMTANFGSEIESAFERRRISIDPDSVANIQYTSGSTSFPKGCMLTHNGMVRNGYSVAERFQTTERDRYLGHLPLFHNLGSVVTLLSALTKGASVVLMEQFDPEEALQLCEAEKVSIVHNVETTLKMLLDTIDRRKYNLSSLRCGFSTGSPDFLRKGIQELGFDYICSVYGLAETSPNVAVGDANDSLEVLVSNEGKPHEGVEVKIIDSSTGNIMPPDGTGEICVRGWNVMKGYYEMPQETEKAIDPEGWLHTGDLGVLDENGYLTYKGRIKEMIRVGGENVSPLEVESLLNAHPKIYEAQVVSVPDPRLVEVCAAVIQLREGVQCDEAEIITYCKERLANFKVPRYVQFVKEFPLTGSEKIPKYKVREEVMTKLGLGN